MVAPVMDAILEVKNLEKNYILIDYLGRRILLKIFRCTGGDVFEEEIKKHEVSTLRDVQIALIPVAMIKTMYQVIQGALIDEIHGGDLRIKNPHLRLALLITGYTQIDRFVEAVREKYVSSRGYYVILKCRDVDQCDKYSPLENCRAVELESLGDSIEYAVKNLKRILSMIT